jgi:elongation factor P--(R)-beta-lysine ligase
MSDWHSTASLDTLQRRAQLISRIRRFFAERNVTEVSTPCLTRCSVTDPNIESIELNAGGFLRTSPEYWHKRLLADGFGDLYELGPAFRAGEAGLSHQPEFTLLEWYRVGWSWQALADEVVALIRYCLDDTVTTDSQHRDGERAVEFRTWNECFRQCLGIDGLEADLALLQRLADDAPPGCSRDMLLDYLMATRIQPTFDPAGITVIHDYPASQAALARLKSGDPAVAERFEAFAGTVELANGYGELCDASEQLNRFKADNQIRRSLGRDPMPIDDHLIAALEAGLPECAGVALGVDRLVMTALRERDIRKVITFPPETGR